MMMKKTSDNTMAATVPLDELSLSDEVICVLLEYVIEVVM